MVRPRFGTFSGGIDLADEKDGTIDSPVAPAGRLKRIRVPLAPVDTNAAEPTVRIGQHVSRGELIAEALSASQVNIFAPLAGRVSGFCTVMLPAQPTGWRESPAVELTDLDHPGNIEPLTENFDSLAADDHSLRLRIAEGSLVTFNQSTVSLSEWIASAKKADVDTLIANVMENTPFVTADHRLLAERGLEVVRGLAILARAIGAARVILAVDHRRIDDYRSAVAPARLYGINHIALAHKYPIGAEAILTKVLTRRRVRPGADSLQVGVAVTDAATCHATYRWVACGELPTARVVTVAGPKVNKPVNLLVPFGAGVEDILESAEAGSESRFVYGSAMTGRHLVSGAVVSSATNALLAMEPTRRQSPTQCIRCGWCGDNCPARINVAALNDDFELGRTAAAQRKNAQACIECGICSYVCPARLPLMQRVRLLKQAIKREKINV